MYRKTKKIIASLVVFMMMVAHLNTIGIQLGQVFAAELSSQNSSTKNSNVEFDSYFIDGENKSYEATKNIGEDNKVIAQITVKNAGYLKDAKISFTDDNFNILNQIDSEKVSNVDVENNILTLNQIDNGEDVVLEIPFTLNHNYTINVSKLNQINKVIFTGVYVDANGKENEIEKEILLELKWTATAEPILESNITKYVPYDVNGQKGIIMQMIVNSYIKDNVLPIKENNIEISVPKINNILPIDVTVRMGENNDDTSYEHNYNTETGILTINAKNDENENGEIFWSNESKGEYIVTLDYSEEALNTIGENGVDINVSMSSNLVTYSYDEKTLTQTYANSINLKDQLGDIIDFTIEIPENISKGYMYANYNREEKLETTYEEKVIANISLPELTDGIVIENKSDKFITETSSYEVSTYYKNIKLDRNELKAILGQDGTIKINDTIINLSEENQENEILVELNTDKVTIQTSKPQEEGKITIQFEKAIRGKLNLSKKQLESINTLETSINAVVVNGETTIIDKDINSNITLVEPVTSAELVLNTTNFSTVITNEDVEFKVILHTDSIYNRLYEAPTITIDLPSYVENINLEDAYLAFEEELSVADKNIVIKEDGTKQIVVTLQGTQTKYSIDSITGGANLIIVADITLNNLTPNKEEQVKLTCVNGAESLEQIVNVNFVAPTGIVTVNKISNYADGAQLMALTDDEEGTLEVETTAKTATAEIQVINNYNNIINNVRILGRTLATETTDTENSSNLENTFDAPMLGAINTNGLENVTIYYTENGSATENLNDTNNGWTTDVTDFSKVKSYLIILNDHTMNVGDSVKFTYDMQIPENLGYSEKVSSVYTVYFDNVQEEQIINDRAKSRVITLETGVAPELEVELSSYSEENSIVREGQYIKFIVTVKNTGTVDANNVRLNITAPSETVYSYENEDEQIIFTENRQEIIDSGYIQRMKEEYEEVNGMPYDEDDETIIDGLIAFEYETKHTEYVEENFYTGYRESEEKEKIIQLGTIKAGETIKTEYDIKVDMANINEFNTLYEENSDTILSNALLSNIVRVIADDMQKEEISNEYKLKIENADIELYVSSDKSIDYVMKKGSNLNYSINLSDKNNNEEPLENIILKVEIPGGIIIKDAKVHNLIMGGQEINSEININNNIVEIIITNPYEGFSITCDIETEIDDILGIVSPKVTAQIENDIYYGNTVQNKVGKLDFSIIQSNLDNKYVKETEEIVFEYKITNITDVYCSDLTFENIAPEGMKITKAIQMLGEYSQILNVEDDNKFTINKDNVIAGETIVIRVVMKADLLPEGKTEKELVNFATISGDGFDTKTSNSVKFVVEYNEEAHKSNNGNSGEIVDGRKVISGLAWLDINKDGERNDDEQLLSGIEVRLIDKYTNEIVKDVNSGEEKITHTSSIGEYTFTNIENGYYLVVFVYNSAKYDLTQYRKPGVSQSANSDFVDVDMEINGVNTTAAVSDTISITNANARNIDIGLVESNKSDLKLDKYISKVTVTYGNTVKTYDYKDVKLAKVEIPAKELSNATVIVEYKMVVTNEGAIANYVKKIVDYVPKDMKFNSELNRDWYQSSNGDIYNSSLANTKLESGETAEVTLTLTKKMTENNTGIVNNNAELYEVYNEEAIEDIDSTPANKISGEDDMSAADVVISVKTGDAIIYTAMISTIICSVIGISIYFIRKKVLRKI